MEYLLSQTGSPVIQLHGDALLVDDSNLNARNDDDEGFNEPDMTGDEDYQQIEELSLHIVIESDETNTITETKRRSRKAKRKPVSQTGRLFKRTLFDLPAETKSPASTSAVTLLPLDPALTEADFLSDFELPATISTDVPVPLTKPAAVPATMPVAKPVIPPTTLPVTIPVNPPATLPVAAPVTISGLSVPTSVPLTVESQQSSQVRKLMIF